MVSDKPATVKTLLIAIEKNRGFAVPQAEGRSMMGVLLPQEEEEIRKGNPPEAVDKLMVAAGVEKLRQVGVFWKTGEPSDATKNVFLEDTGAGLTPLEEDIVRLQVESFVDGNPMNSHLLSEDDIRKISEQLKKEGIKDSETFFFKVLELAMARDDEADARARL
jgi:hypothetical protein